jgi:hypothetical protein
MAKTGYWSSSLFRHSLGISFYVLLFPVVLIWRNVEDLSQAFTFTQLGNVLGIEAMAGLYVALAALVVGVLGSILAKNNSFFDRLMSFGGAVALYFMGVVILGYFAFQIG